VATQDSDFAVQPLVRPFPRVEGQNKQYDVMPASVVQPAYVCETTFTYKPAYVFSKTPIDTTPLNVTLFGMMPAYATVYDIPRFDTPRTTSNKAKRVRSARVRDTKPASEGLSIEERERNAAAHAADAGWQSPQNLEEAVRMYVACEEPELKKPLRIFLAASLNINKTILPSTKSYLKLLVFQEERARPNTFAELMKALTDHSM